MPLSNPTPVVGADGWTIDAATWTRTANTTFTTAGDTTAQFAKGTRLKVTDTTTKYFVVAASSFAAGTTTVTITGGDDYVLAADPSSRYYSYAASPQGYPTWFTYTPTATGFSGGTTLVQVFTVVGRQCTLYYYISGTSNATSLTFLLPIPVGTGVHSSSIATPAEVVDNTVTQTATGRIDLGTIGSTSATAYKTAAAGAWTNTGTKRVQGLLTYSI